MDRIWDETTEDKQVNRRNNMLPKMEDDTSSSTSASCGRLSSTPPRRRKRRRGRCFPQNESVNFSAQSSEYSDTNYNVESKKSEKRTQISSWTKERSEACGLYYENKASTFSDFYDLFNSCGGKTRYGFTCPLDGEERSLLDSLLEQTNELIEKHGVEMRTDLDWAVAADWPHVFTECRKTVRTLSQNLSQTFRPATGSVQNRAISHFLQIDLYLTETNTKL